MQFFSIAILRREHRGLLSALWPHRIGETTWCHCHLSHAITLPKAMLNVSFDSLHDGESVLLVGADHVDHSSRFGKTFANSKNPTLTISRLDADDPLHDSGERVWCDLVVAIGFANTLEGQAVDWFDDISRMVDAGKVVGMDLVVSRRFFQSAHSISKLNQAPTTGQWRDPRRINLLFAERDSVRPKDASDERLQVELPRGAQLFLSGRRMWTGGQEAAVLLPGSTDQPSERIQISQHPVDLIALQRSLRDRIHGLTPIQQTARIVNGTLVLVGGGRIPAGLLGRFVELAGGDESDIVVLPTAAPDPISNDIWIVDGLERLGAKRVTVMRDRDRKLVESPSFLSVINRATGVWFCGGRQWRFVDAYQGTRALDAFRAVLERGGVIGGTSAGASIQADYLARGNPLGNTDIMAAGYERGFGFLPGTAVDQHFSQRNRMSDLQLLVRSHPSVLGIGLDEGTAIIVAGTEAEVVGAGSVYFVSPRIQGDEPRKVDTVPFAQLKSGGRFDLVKSAVVSTQ